MNTPNNNTVATIVFAVIVAVMILSVTVIIITGNEPDDMIMLLSGTLVPGVIALWAGNRAGKAAELSQQAVDNTNGRLRELIKMVTDSGGSVDPDKYADVMEHINECDHNK